jgi:MoaA/NifB/PqqE/SkfB family radical SAM enzyme
MYNYLGIRKAHMELSTNCQAKCPMCARNIHGGADNPNLPIVDINLALFKQIMTKEFLQQLTTISVCGNFGDALLNNDLIPIVQYINDTNPNIILDIHTNGSLRSSKWWKDFAHALPANHLIHFGIDGLADTHSIYRIGTDFNKIIKNAKTFIDAGGQARWNFITFRHNEHQLEDARQLSKQLGFNSFQEKQTSRFIGNPWFDVMDESGNVIYKLENPTEQKIIFIEKKTVDNYKEIINNSKIVCEVEDTKSVYIDGQGYLWPCCFVAGVRNHYSRPDMVVHNYTKDNIDSFNAMVDKFGGIEQFNLRKRSVKEIVDSIEWQTLWDDSFVNDKLPVCGRTCGKFEEPIVSQCRDQFLELEKFDEN